MHLSLLNSDDERLGLPSGSTFKRLTQCPASHRLSQKARELGTVVHETSLESERGTLIHNAYELQSAEGLSDSDAADYEAIMMQREAITAEWLPKGQPVKRIAEERLWLHRGLRPVLSGKVDELLIASDRALLFDVKTGRPGRPAELKHAAQDLLDAGACSLAEAGEHYGRDHLASLFLCITHI